MVSYPEFRLYHYRSPTWKFLILISNQIYINMSWTNVSRFGKNKQNKLHELNPDFNSKCSFLGYSRQIQTKITRCRIGHTRLTHAYLLTNEQPPFCISCNEPFTVKHFLITCTEFNYVRNKYYTAKTIKELFSDTSSDKIINFLKETNLFNKL